MTEKRFNMNKSGDLYDKNNLLMLDFGYSYDGVGCKRIIDLLNDLNDDNEQLKHRIKKLQNDLNNYSEIFNELNALVDENEQLKQKLKEHETTLKGQSNSIYQLKKKKELKESIDRIDSLIHTQEDYLAWSIIYETLTGGKPLGYRLKM